MGSAVAVIRLSVDSGNATMCAIRAAPPMYSEGPATAAARGMGFVGVISVAGWARVLGMTIITMGRGVPLSWVLLCFLEPQVTSTNAGVRTPGS